jgi:ferrochelatase
MKKDAVLIIGFGAPDGLEDVRPFLEGILRGQRVAPGRIETVISHYKDIGGGSPYNKLTVEQATALRDKLKVRGHEISVYVGMRNWHPFLRDVVKQMADDGVTRIIKIIAAPHHGPASTAKYESALAEALRAIAPMSIETVSIDPWFEHPKFIAALAARVEEALKDWPEERRAQAEHIFTAHSVPVDPTSPYECQVWATAKALAENLGLSQCTIAYQSRSGNPADPWLGPDILETLKKLVNTGAREVVVTPIGFVCDHVEVLYDLDIQARQLCAKLGMNFTRPKTVGTHPLFIEMLADLTEETLRT